MVDPSIAIRASLTLMDGSPGTIAPTNSLPFPKLHAFSTTDSYVSDIQSMTDFTMADQTRATMPIFPISQWKYKCEVVKRPRVRNPSQGAGNESAADSGHFSQHLFHC